MARARLAISEEIACAQRFDNRAAFAPDGIGHTTRFRYCPRPFFAIECPREGVLSRASRAGVAIAKRSESSRRRWRVMEVAAGQGVADADVMVEVGERWDESDVCLRAFDHDRQPEPEFAQPHGHRVTIDAENGASEYVTADFVDRTAITGA